MNRAALMRGIRGMATHNGLGNREDLHAAVMSILDLDLNSPIEGLSDLSGKQLQAAYDGFLYWQRIQKVREANGSIIEEAKETLPHLFESGLSKEIRQFIQSKLEGSEHMPTTVDQDVYQSAIEDLINEVNSKGRSPLILGAGATGLWPENKRVVTGSLDLDMCIGIGGLPRGRIHEIFGQESSGKSSLMQIIAAQAQRAGMIAVYIDAENSLDPTYAKKLGVDTDRLIVNFPGSLQEAIQTIRDICKTTQQEGMPDAFIVVDSVPTLPAMEVEDGDAEQNQFRALNARHWSQWMPTIMKAVRDANATLMLINQTRTAQDMYTKLSDTTPGGKAIKFAATNRLHVKRSTPDGSKTDAGATSQATTVEVIKNKVGSPYKTAYYTLNLGVDGKWGIDQNQDTIDGAVAWGVIEADTKFEGGEFFDKKGWFSLRLRKGWLDVMRSDEKEAWLRANTDKNGEITVNEEDFESDWADDAVAITAYQQKKFLAELSEYPSLLPLIHEVTLDILNDGVGIQDEENLDEEEFEVDEDADQVEKD